LEKISFEFPSGNETFTIESGIIAKQAGGAVMVYRKGLALLCAATGSREPREGIDWFPLTCDYEERFYAAGKFPGGFIKREGRPSENAVLTSRRIDRPIRPLFPEDFHNDVQIIVTAMSQDNEQIADVFAIIGASVALAISDIPYEKPIGAVRLGRIAGEFIYNPTFAQLAESDLNLLVAGTEDRINMIEDESSEVTEEVILEGLELAHAEIKKQIAIIKQWAAAQGKPKFEYKPDAHLDEKVAAHVEALIMPKLQGMIPETDKYDLYTGIKDLTKLAAETVPETFPDADIKAVKHFVHDFIKKYMRKRTMEGVRIDGRDYNTVRPLAGMIDFLPRVHGSAMFQRGQTQVCSMVTLGSSADRQRIDTVNFDDLKRYTHHYNFPPFSVGEVRPLRGTGRREIGHGALAEKAVVPVLPSEADFPYTMRVVSEVTESNASSSMASACASSMALMAAGVPLTRPVGGISIGLVTEGDEYRLLMDLNGLEDHNGDMDFKVTGTTEGITAIQLDVKIEGLTLQMIRETLALAKTGRLKVIEQMAQIIAEPRGEISQFAPMLETINIPVDAIGLVIGPSGKNIKRIVAETGCDIDIDEDGRVYISGLDREGIARAKGIIKGMTGEIQAGEEFSGKVVRIMPFGAFIELVPGRDGLLHVSNMAEGRVDNPEDVVSIGDVIPVKVREIDDNGKINLLRTDIDYSNRPQGPPGGGGRGGDRGPRRDDRGGGDRGGRGGYGGGGDRGGRGGGYGGGGDRGPRREGGFDRDRAPREGGNFGGDRPQRDDRGRGGFGGDRDRGPRPEGGINTPAGDAASRATEGSDYVD
jgi:polyribonucleotide nucleotidyltransferase